MKIGLCLLVCFSLFSIEEDSRAQSAIQHQYSAQADLYQTSISELDYDSDLKNETGQQESAQCLAGAQAKIDAFLPAIQAAGINPIVQIAHDTFVPILETSTQFTPKEKGVDENDQAPRAQNYYGTCSAQFVSNSLLVSFVTSSVEFDHSKNKAACDQLLASESAAPDTLVVQQITGQKFPFLNYCIVNTIKVSIVTNFAADDFTPSLSSAASQRAGFRLR